MRALGIPVVIGHRAENIAEADVVVHSTAVRPDNVSAPPAAPPARSRPTAPSCWAWPSRGARASASPAPTARAPSRR
ncbi:MAG: hypothetical protein R3F60_31165 [bacterium]